MTIKPIDQAPNPYNGIYNPPADLLYQDGYRIMPEQPPIADGYTRISATLIEGDGINGVWECIDCLTSDIEQEQQQSDLILNAELYKWENRTIQFLRRIGAILPDAVSAPENIATIIEEQLYNLSQDETKSAQYVALVTRAAMLREQIERYGGTLSKITWHELT